jgi:hypothetical protein
MLLYNVTINIDKAIETEWLDWMKSQHVPKVMATGLPLQSKVLKLLTEIDNGGATYTFQYFFENMAAYEIYQQLHSPSLQNHVKERYEGKFVSFRTLLEEV